MSATATLIRRQTYEQQVKLMRAETVVSWAAAAFDWMIAALKIEPVALERDEDVAARQRWFGAFY